MSAIRVRRHIEAPPVAVYRALLDADAVARWKTPEGMTAKVHEFEPRVGGALRISLTHAARAGAGETSARTDTYHGRFVELVPNEKVVEVNEFETDDPRMQGAMTVTITLAASGAGTEVVAVHTGRPRGSSAADVETGWRMTLAKLAALVEVAPRERPR